MSLIKIKESPKEKRSIPSLFLSILLIYNKGKERKVQSFSLIMKSAPNYISFQWSPQICLSEGIFCLSEAVSVVIYKLLELLISLKISGNKIFCSCTHRSYFMQSFDMVTISSAGMYSSFLLSTLCESLK